MRAVLMVGGRGMRLRPFTATIPKPLVPIGGECPIIEVLLRQLGAAGVHRVTLATGHLGHLIRSYVGDGSRWGLDVDYWEDPEPLGTVGPLLAHADELPEHFLLLNGDLLCDLDFAALHRFHLDHGADVTVAAARREVCIDFGVLDADGVGLRGFTEKPSLEYLVNMGVYVIAREALAGFEPGRPMGADELVRDRIESGRANLFAFDGYWLDIGRPEDYERANVEFPLMRERLLGRSDTVIDLRDRAAGPAVLALEGIR